MGEAGVGSIWIATVILGFGDVDVVVVDSRVRQQALGHLSGPLAGAFGVVGVEVDFEAVRGPEVFEFEPEPFEGLLCRFGLGVEDAPLQPDGDGRGVGGHI